MHKLLKLLAICAPLAVLPGVVGAKGCIKGAIVGGILGHYARHHAVLGAAAGCVIEHEREKALRQEKNRAERAAPAYLAPAQPPPVAQPSAHPNLPPPSPLI